MFADSTVAHLSIPAASLFPVHFPLYHVVFCFQWGIRSVFLTWEERYFIPLIFFSNTEILIDLLSWGVDVCFRIDMSPCYAEVVFLCPEQISFSWIAGCLPRMGSEDSTLLSWAIIDKDVCHYSCFRNMVY